MLIKEAVNDVQFGNCVFTRRHLNECGFCGSVVNRLGFCMSCGAGFFKEVSMTNSSILGSGELPLPRPGQVWADNDPRSYGREFVIHLIIGDYAICRSGNRTTRIKLNRFKPTASGYRFVREVL